MSEDWFRKTTWTGSDEEDFFSRLNRSRKHNRSQYLRIQASHLAGVGVPSTTEAALQLLEILFAQYPDGMEMASAYLQKAECLVALGRTRESLEFFKKSIDFQRSFPNVHTQAPLEYGLVVIEHDLRDEYPLVLEVLEEFEPFVSDFPVDRFRISGVKAVIFFQSDNKKDAVKNARRALAEAETRHSGFRYHPTIGLVGDRDAALLKRLEEIARYQ